MKDPVEDKIRSFYDSIQRDAPARLEHGVLRALDAAPGRAGIGFARPAFGLLVAVSAVLILAVAVRGLVPGPATSPSVVFGESASPTATVVETPTQSPSPTPSATASPEPTPTPSPTLAAYPSDWEFSRTGAMNPVIDGPAVALKDGRVLVVGGTITRSNGLRIRTNVAEIYDPVARKFTATGSMAEPRTRHTATVLNDGRVLVTGGADLSDGFDNQATAEIYNPATGKFTATGPMRHGRAEHTATLLPSGKVLVTGGFGGGTNALKTAEIYDPATGKFTATGSMSLTREYHTATLLPNGLVLVAGGLDDGDVTTGVTATAELYDPATGRFKPTGVMTTPREWHTATLLDNGLVLIAGGAATNGTTALATAELYDPSTGQFRATGSMHAGRVRATATVFAGGFVLMAGGEGLATAEVYSPVTGAFGPKIAMLGRVSSAALIPYGEILLTGNPAVVYRIPLKM